MSEELKPCPFCGGKPHAQLMGRMAVRYWEVVCDNECVFSGPPKDTEEQAIGAWNRRDPDAAKDAEIEKLKAALELGCTAVAELALEICGEDQSVQSAARLIERAGPASSLGIMRDALKGDAA